MSTAVALSRTAGEPGMPIVLLDWRPLRPRRNTLCGYAKILLGRALTIDDILVHVSHGRAWATYLRNPWSATASTRSTPRPASPPGNLTSNGHQIAPGTDSPIRSCGRF